MKCSRCGERESEGILLALCASCMDWVDDATRPDAPPDLLAEAERVIVSAQEKMFHADGFRVVRGPRGEALGLAP